MAKLYGVGVGPGDKELLTIKAIKTIGKCDVIVVPSAMNGGKSIAHEIAE
ncbi:MAG TPA: SAM-dependent methyltransferase, partial [Clostridium sp.]